MLEHCLYTSKNFTSFYGSFSKSPFVTNNAYVFTELVVFYIESLTWS